MENKEYTIGEICSRFSSGKNITSEDIHEQGMFPVYGGNGLRGYTDRSNFIGECSIIGRQGAYCGNVRFFSGEGYMSDHAVVAVTNNNHDNRYFSYKLSLMELGRFSGQAAQPGISVSKVAKVKVEMPPLAIQQRIASILSAYDNLIENNNKRIRLLEQMAENLYKEWFVRFRFPGHETCELSESKLGKLPSTFQVTNMGNVFDYYIGGGWGNDESSDEYPITANVIRGADFPNVWHYNLSSCPRRFHKVSNYKTRQLKDGDIIMEISGGTSEQPVGRTVLVTQDMINRFERGNVICASFCKLIRLNRDLISPYFFYYWMRYLYDTRIIDRFQLQSTGIINFKFEPFLKNGLVMLPPKETQNAFEKQVVPLFKEINQLAVQIENLSRQRDLLLPRLMSGKLEVNV